MLNAKISVLVVALSAVFLCQQACADHCSDGLGDEYCRGADENFSVAQLHGSAMSWTATNLYQEYRYPTNLIGTIEDLPFPQPPARWYGNKTTGVSFKSIWIPKIGGFSFTGQITPWNSADKVLGNKNAFAIFYHQVINYSGGAEYGLVFRVDQKDIIFYTLTKANLPSQQWQQWPAQMSAINLQGNVKLAMQSASQIQTWSIALTPQGDFILSLTNATTQGTSSCKILKPNYFPNLYQADGYITLCAQKFQNVTLINNPHLKVQQIDLLLP
jgi:hypothetical protein